MNYSFTRSKKPSLIERLKYISVLKKEFQNRKKENKFYSLRAFAKLLQLDPIHLSRIFKNQKGLSRNKAEIASRKLSHLDFSQRQEFILTVTSISAHSQLARNLAKMGLRNREKLKQARAAASTIAVR